MKYQFIAHLFAAAALSVAFSAHAHDPKEHMQNAEKPDCTAMEKMDHSDMDMNDPVMQAMMKKCMQDQHHDHADDHSSSEDNAQTDQQHSAHQH